MNLDTIYMIAEYLIMNKGFESMHVPFQWQHPDFGIVVRARQWANGDWALTAERTAIVYKANSISDVNELLGKIGF